MALWELFVKLNITVKQIFQFSWWNWKLWLLCYSFMFYVDKVQYLHYTLSLLNIVLFKTSVLGFIIL